MEKKIPEEKVYFPKNTFYFKTQYGNIIDNFIAEMRYYNDGLN